MVSPGHRVTDCLDPTAFARAASDFLLGAAAMNNLLLRLLRDVSRGPPAPAPRGWSIQPASGPADAPWTGLALWTPPRHLLLSEPCEGWETLCDHLADLALPGVTGPAPLARAFAARWAVTHPVVPALSMSLRVFEAASVEGRGVAAGRGRPAGEDDLPRLAEWTRAFHAEAVPHDPAPAAPVDPAGYRLWENPAGTVVAMAYAAPATETTAFLNQVYTPPAQRGRGYAQAVVADTTRAMLGGGMRRCFLFTDLSNPVSNGMYPKVGYRPAGDCVSLRFEPRPAR